MRDAAHVCLMCRLFGAQDHTHVANFTSIKPLNSHLDNTQTFQLFHSCTATSAAHTTAELLGELPGWFVRLIAAMLEISTPSQFDRG